MSKIHKPHLSIVIPVYNEEKRVNNLIQIISYFKKQRYSWEVIVVNDGSTDKTIRKLKLLKNKASLFPNGNKLRFKILSYYPNTGKGFAIKTGMLSATGKHRLFLDIDLSTPIDEVDKFLPFLKKFDIVIGSRKMKSSEVIVRQSLLREFLGKTFTYISQKILQMNVSDFTCGFKCFNDKAAEVIFAKQKIHRWGFDPEILYIGKSKKHSIKEVPVRWKNDPGTKVKFPRDIINSLIELVLIRLNSLRGLYR